MRRVRIRVTTEYINGPMEGITSGWEIECEPGRLGYVYAPLALYWSQETTFRTKEGDYRIVALSHQEFELGITL